MRSANTLSKLVQFVTFGKTKEFAKDFSVEERKNGNFCAPKSMDVVEDYNR